MNSDDWTFAEFIRIWARVALILVFVEAYLTVNKIWIRKHEAVVSESVSVAAQLIALVTGVPFVILYATEGALEGAIADGVFLLVNLVMIMIGIGIWVEGRRGQGFWNNLRKAVRLERGEATMLLKNVWRPAAAEQVIRILHALALIDNDFDERERQFIEEFAREWNIDLDATLANEPDARRAGNSFLQLRHLVQDYLETSPPREQVRHLWDVMSSLANIDDNISDEEELIMGELASLLENYAGTVTGDMFAVFIAPQNPAQEVMLAELMPNLRKKTRLGGEVFRIGAYYSAAYADLVCECYRESGYLTINEQEPH